MLERLDIAAVAVFLAASKVCLLVQIEICPRRVPAAKDAGGERVLLERGEEGGLLRIKD